MSPSAVLLASLAPILHQAAFVLFALGALLALGAGALLLLDSARAFRIAARLDRWVSTRAALEPLDRYRSIGPALHRRHRLYGMLISAAALYAIVVIASADAEAGLKAVLSAAWPERLRELISDSVRITLLAGNAAALAFGILFFVRPGVLMRLERWADRKVSLRQAIKPAEDMRTPLDRFARARPRLLGAFLVAGSLYVLANLGYVLIR